MKKRSIAALFSRSFALLLLYGWHAAAPMILSQPISLAIVLGLMSLAVITFTWPWRSEMLSAAGTAMLFPFVLWTIEQVLLRVALR